MTEFQSHPENAYAKDGTTLMTKNLTKRSKMEFYYEKGCLLAKRGCSLAEDERWPGAIRAFKEAKLAFEEAKSANGIISGITIQHSIDDTLLHGARAMYHEAMKCSREPVDKELSHLLAESLLGEAKKLLDEIAESSPSRNNLYRTVRDGIGTASGRFSVWGAADTALENYYSSKQSTTSTDASESQRSQHLPKSDSDRDVLEAVSLITDPNSTLAAILTKIADDRESGRREPLFHEIGRVSLKR
ncbi:MAG TPA: hypothetical protein VGZ00_04875 [Candidatus Baltobacteraceae bacterium]|nr:hypothetical protein [Candidatus Baltobacteraceae bacterium]